MSYHTLAANTIVDCGQALVSYNAIFTVSAEEAIVDCGQALVSYNPPSCVVADS